MARKGGIDRGICQRKDRPGWWVRVFVHGRQRMYRCDTKSQAKALYGRLRAELREGTYFPEKYAPKKEITLRAWIKRCQEGSTNRGLGNELRYGRRWTFYLGSRLLSQITVDDLRRTQARMRAKLRKLKNGKKQQRLWADATINRHFAYLKHVLMLAVKQDLLRKNPVSEIKFFPEAHRTRFLTDEELTRLQGVMSQADWLLVAFAIETGLRREEQFHLRWDQVDLENGVLTIPLPKGGKTRHVPLSDQAQALLRGLGSFLESGWVFPGLRGTEHPMDCRAFLRRSFEPALRQAGIQGASWHTLRHTAASRRVMAGVDLVTVKEFLGHREIDTTLRYSHLSPSHLRDAVNKGSLSGTATKTATTQNGEQREDTQLVEFSGAPDRT